MRFGFNTYTYFAFPGYSCRIRTCTHLRYLALTCEGLHLWPYHNCERISRSTSHTLSLLAETWSTTTSFEALFMYTRVYFPLLDSLNGFAARYRSSSDAQNYG